MRARALTCIVVSVSTFSAAQPRAHARRAPGAGGRQAQADELRVLREKLLAMKGRLIDTGRAGYVAGLKAFLRRCANHPIAPDILVALGEIHEDSPRRAAAYYAAAARHPLGGPWFFTQQDALRRLARAYERLGEHRKAVAVIERWEPREPCGTGRGVSEVRKRFILWRLRLGCEDRDDVYAEVWAAVPGLNSGRGFVGGKRLARFVRPLYADADLARLERDLDGLAAREPVARPGNALDSLRAKMTAEFVAELRARIALERKIAAATEAGLVELVADPARRHRGTGNLQSLFTPDRDGCPSREKLLLDAAARKGREALPGLIELDEAGHNATAVAAIGRIGGARAVEYLTRKASSETHRAALTDCYFALLLTQDDGARATVEMAARTDENARRAREAFSASVFLAEAAGTGGSARTHDGRAGGR